MSARSIAAAFALTGLMIANPAIVHAQSMLDMVDLQSDAFTKSEMSRADIDAGLAKLKDGEKLNLFAKALNGLDLSGMDPQTHQSASGALKWHQSQGREPGRRGLRPSMAPRL